MTPEALEARRAYKRAWARKNPDKIKAQQARYWEKQAAMKTDEEEQDDEEKTKPV